VGSKLVFGKISRRLLRDTFVCVFLFAGNFSYAQDCSDNLDQAKSLYREGKLYDIPGIMENCLGDNDLERGQRVEAFELLSLTYLYIDEPELAEESYLNLLDADPEYQPDSIIEVEIEFLSKKFKTTPIFTVYPAKLGTNVTFPRVVNTNGTDNTNNSKQSYKSQWGFQFGGGADWHISNSMSLGAEVWFDYKSFRFNNRFFDADSLQISENQMSIEFPVFARYTQKVKENWYPYILGGYSLSYLIQSDAAPEFYEITEIRDANGDVEERIINPDIGRTLNLSNIRTRFNHNLVLGLGVKYRLLYEYISVEVRYTAGLKNVLNVNNQFDFGNGGEQNDLRELTFKYGQVDNDFRLDDLSITFGYVHPLYKPRKIQKKSGKGFIGNLFKSKEKSTY